MYLELIDSLATGLHLHTVLAVSDTPNPRRFDTVIATDALSLLGNLNTRTGIDVQIMAPNPRHL
ncbi:hypothetical protein WT55_27985 [Burkholderia pseudomultivorans]|nr:hypothetical protein WT55_27985 [Burkholderia pseudomultivorans]